MICKELEQLIRVFINSYLAAPWPTLNHFQGANLTNPKLINAFYLIWPKGHKKPRSKAVCLGPTKHLVGLNWKPFNFNHNTLIY